MDFWGIFAAICALASVAIAVVAYLRPPSHRAVARLEYVVLSNQSLFVVPEGISVTISIEGRPVRQAFVTVIRVANTGTINFSSADWESPLTIQLGGAVISAKQIAARPKELRLSPLRTDGRGVEIRPFLLNAGDLFDVQVISEGPLAMPSVSARIAGLEQVRRRKSVYNLGNGVDGSLDTSNKIVYWFFGLVLALGVAITFIGPLFAGTTPYSVSPLAWFTVSALALYLWFLRWATVRNRRWRPDRSS